MVPADEQAADSDVAWCRTTAAEKGDEDGAALAEMLLLMSRTQRRKLGRLL